MSTDFLQDERALQVVRPIDPYRHHLRARARRQQHQQATIRRWIGQIGLESSICHGCRYHPGSRPGSSFCQGSVRQGAICQASRFHQGRVLQRARLSSDRSKSPIGPIPIESRIRQGQLYSTTVSAAQRRPPARIGHLPRASARDAEPSVPRGQRSPTKRRLQPTAAEVCQPQTHFSLWTPTAAQPDVCH